MNSLDLMIVVFMVFTAVGILSLSLMFLARKKIWKKLSLFLAAAMGIYAASVGIYIGGAMFPAQSLVGAAAGLGGISAVVLSLLAKGDEKKEQLARLMAAFALVVGAVNMLV